MWQYEEVGYLEQDEYDYDCDDDYEKDYEFVAYRPINMDKSLVRDRKISILINSNRFSLDSVYIMKEDEKYKLVVIHNRKVLKEKYYKTAKGCRSVFSMSYGGSVEEKIIPQWSDFW